MHGKRDQKNIKDFATGGGLGIFVLTLTFSATYHSSYAFMGAGGFVFKNGVGWWVNGLWTVLPGVLFWIWGRRFWYLGKRYNYCSVADYASDVYESHTVGILVTVITMVFTIPYVAMQAIGCSYIFTTMSGGTLSYTVGASVFMVVMIILVWMGGMKGVAITDAAQGVFMWVGLVFGSLWVVLKNFPSVADAFAAAYAECPALFTLPGPQGVCTMQDWLSRWIVITFGMMMFPHITLRFFAGKFAALKWSAVFSLIYLTYLHLYPGSQRRWRSGADARLGSGRYHFAGVAAKIYARGVRLLDHCRRVGGVHVHWRFPAPCRQYADLHGCIQKVY